MDTFKTISQELEYLQLTEDKVFYLQVWKERRHHCQCCGAALYKPHLFMFHHVLEKRVKQHSSYVDYSRFRHCLWNILLLCWGCHDAYERNPAIKRLQSIVDYKQNLVDILEDGDYDYDKQHIWRSEEDIIEHALIQSLFGKHPLTYA